MALSYHGTIPENDYGKREMLGTKCRLRKKVRVLLIPPDSGKPAGTFLLRMLSTLGERCPALGSDRSRRAERPPSGGLFSSRL
jgi:hypothetical protein